MVVGILNAILAPDGALAVLVSLAALTTFFALAYYGYRTANALGSSVGWLWALAMFVPCLNVITLLVLSSRATRACREHGVPVGFLGPKVPEHEPGEAEVFGPS